MSATIQNIRQLLPHGSAVVIANKLGISTSAVSQALKAARPSSRVVQEALRIAKENGSLEAQRTLNSLKVA